jgi:hypothetical protein
MKEHLQKRRAEELRELEGARHQRLRKVRTREELTIWREEFGVFLGWGRGNSKPGGALYGDSKPAQ